MDVQHLPKADGGSHHADNPIRLMTRGLLLLTLGFVNCLAASAAAPAAAQPVVQPAPTQPDPGAALDALVDSKLATPLRQAVLSRRNSAVTVIFVRDGKVRIRVAEGFEDAQQRTPITASDSRFQIASISKTMVGVSLEQLKTSGRIASFDDPANRYLKTYQLPDSYGQQVTLRQLATHTAGLDLTGFGHSARQPQPGVPTALDFEHHQPQYFRPPGEITAYSNFGVDALGLLISDVTGMPYRTYVQTSILQPLGMLNTVVGYPDGDTIPHEVHPYDTLAARPIHPNFYARPITVPSSGLFTTGDDMGRFMLALLDRSPGERPITAAMQDEMFHVMHEDAPLGGAHGLVFELMRTKSTVTIYHSGFTDALNCLMALVPARQAGLFLCLSHSPTLAGVPADREPLEPADVVRESLETLIAGSDDRTSEGGGVAQTDWNPAWGPYLGGYVSTSRQYFGIGRLRSLLHPPQSLRVEHGTTGLKIDGVDGVGALSPGVFRSPNGTEYFTFFNDSRTGRILLTRSTEANAVYEKPQPKDNPRLVRLLLAAAIAIGATGLIWPFWPHSRIAGLARAAAVLFGIGMVGATLAFGSHPFGDRYLLGIGWPIVLMRSFGFLVIPAAVLLTVALLLGWSRTLPKVSRLARTHLVLLTLGSWFAVAVLTDVGVISFLTR